MAAAATAAAEIAADADGGKVATDDDDAVGLTTLSSSTAALVLMPTVEVVAACCIDSPEEDEAADEDRAGDVEFTVAAAVAVLETLPVAEEMLFNSEPIDSSLCHLELRAALIWVHSSFLHDLDLLIDCNQSLNCALPSGVIWNAFRADKIVLVNSS